MNDRQIALRMADANRNRVMEGLRTLEDIARFQDFARLQSGYKAVRHALQEAFEDWDAAALLAARNAEQDVGRTEKHVSELSRAGGIRDIAASAAGRSEQGLRVLEETAKLLYPASALRFESLRYNIYDLNAQLQQMLARESDFLNRSQLYLLADCRLPVKQFLERICAVSDAGVDILQIRDKTADAATLVRYINEAIDALDPKRTRVIVNDRVDVASCCKAWGCHVGQEDLLPNSARQLLRGDQVLGISTHDMSQIHRAIEDGADYIGCGPTFPSQTKAFEQYAGLAFLVEAATFLQHCPGSPPAFAIGGITPENLPRVLDAGLHRIAVSGCVWHAADPPAVAATLKEALLACHGGRKR